MLWCQRTTLVFHIEQSMNHTSLERGRTTKICTKSPFAVTAQDTLSGNSRPYLCCQVITYETTSSRLAEIRTADSVPGSQNLLRPVGTVNSPLGAVEGAHLLNHVLHQLTDTVHKHGQVLAGEGSGREINS